MNDLHICPIISEKIVKITIFSFLQSVTKWLKKEKKDKLRSSKKIFFSLFSFNSMNFFKMA